MSSSSQSRNTDNTEWHDMPEDILVVIGQAESAKAQLQELSRHAGIERNFTLDGRLVGDIGELLVARHYKIVSNKKPKGHAHDLFAIVNGREHGVQVKLRQEGGGDLGFRFRPDILIILEYKKDWSQWREVYHGPGSVIVGDGIIVDENRSLKKDNAATSLVFTIEQLRQKCPVGSPYKLTPKLKTE